MKTKKHYVVTKALGRVWEDKEVKGLVIEASPENIKPVAQHRGLCTLKGYIHNGTFEWAHILEQNRELHISGRVRLRTPEDKVLLLKPKH